MATTPTKTTSARSAIGSAKLVRTTIPALHAASSVMIHTSMTIGATKSVHLALMRTTTEFAQSVSLPVVNAPVQRTVNVSPASRLSEMTLSS